MGDDLARPRSFNEDEVLHCAMLTFWRLGYDATTYKVMEGATGVGVRSMHNTFGEKDDLFARSLRMYREMAEGVIAQVFETPGTAAICMLFEGMTQPKDDPDDINHSGCLMVNTVFEVTNLPEAADAEVKAYRAMWLDTFQTALEADHIADAQKRAEYLLGSLWGVLSQIRLARDTAAGEPMAAVVRDTVRSWA